MTTKSILAHCLCFSLVSTFALAEKSEPDQGKIKGINLASPDFKKLFDGKTLDGWEILPGGQWKVDNGAIIGHQEKIPVNDMHAWVLKNVKKFSDPLSFRRIAIHEPMVESIEKVLKLPKKPVKEKKK